MGEMIGVFGGVGPVASAEFVRTIYAHCDGVAEQDFPAVLLYSDPGIAARGTLVAGRDVRIEAQVTRGLQLLADQGCDKIVMCCMTLHRILPFLPARLRDRVVSTVDVLVDAVAAAPPVRRLMMCSIDTWRMHLLQEHPKWTDIASSVVWPSEADNVTLQQAIQEIKENRGTDAAVRWLDDGMREYEVSSAIVGCSEIHVLARAHSFDVIDPFDVTARSIAARQL
ncbi:aspartate/glutamate racemase family protein [Actinocrispum wychmicini]|uniref:Aspartate racemase n=1 Tax=Actinocrispum wychmicini TaxID=1213861 RepID=A0A4R2K4A1_9PSEU|nr:aspartate/glutamate racemase family protein [Actinocrispum wychmicini]TCO61165.1 aspartate racemase [Actinocrispum wychmicini]